VLRKSVYRAEVCLARHPRTILSSAAGTCIGAGSLLTIADMVANGVSPVNARFTEMRGTAAADAPVFASRSGKPLERSRVLRIEKDASELGLAPM